MAGLEAPFAEWSSPGAVAIASVIDAKDVNDANGVVDAVDHAVGASAGAVPVLERGMKALTDSVGIVQQGADDELVGRDRDGRWQVLGELAAGCGGDAQDVSGGTPNSLVGPAAASFHRGRQIRLGLAFAGGQLDLGGVQSSHRVRIGQDREGRLEGLEILGCDQHGGRLAVDGDSDPLVLSADSVDDLGKVGLGFGE